LTIIVHVFAFKFDWMRYLKDIFDDVNITMTPEEEVVVYAPKYLKQMIELVHNTNNR